MSRTSEVQTRIDILKNGLVTNLNLNEEQKFWLEYRCAAEALRQRPK